MAGGGVLGEHSLEEELGLLAHLHGHLVLDDEVVLEKLLAEVEGAVVAEVFKDELREVGLPSCS